MSVLKMFKPIKLAFVLYRAAVLIETFLINDLLSTASRTTISLAYISTASFLRIPLICSPQN